MSKQGPPPDVVEIEQAKRNAAIAKERMQTTVGALKQRVHPRTLASDAADTVKQKTGAIGDQARQRPGIAAAAAGVFTLIVLRKPLKKLGRRLFSRKAKEEREERKAAKQVEKDWRQAEKNAKREAKQLKRDARRIMRDPDERERVARLQREQTVEADLPTQDPDILRTAATSPASVPAQQE